MDSWAAGGDGSLADLAGGLQCPARGGRGGRNRQPLDPWARAHYSDRNHLPAEALKKHDTQVVLWSCACRHGCHVAKSPHAVANNARRCAERHQRPSCFACPLHGPGDQLGIHAMLAYDCAHQVAVALRAQGAAVTVVWAARAVEGQGPFDMWFYEHGVLVEVDPEQTAGGAAAGASQSTGGGGGGEQGGCDRAKDAAAVGAGFRVVRLHPGDLQVFGLWLVAFMLRTMAGLAPGVYYTPSYRRTVFA